MRSEPAYYVLTHMPTRFFYVGSTDDLYRRIANHRSQLNRGVHPNAKLQEVYTCWDDMHLDFEYYPTLEPAKEREQRILDQFHGTRRCCNTYNDARAHWLKGTMPGDHSFRRVNYGKEVCDERRESVSRWHKGKEVSDETREAIRQACLARGPGATKARAVIIHGVRYPSIRAAAVALGLPSPTVRNRVLSDSELRKEWKWAD